MGEQPFSSLSSAVQDFREARRKAALQGLLARLRGESVDLLSYEEVSRKLRAGSSRARGLQEIPLDAIVGSVGRYDDFNRHFLPRTDSDEERWARVKLAMESKGLPPIEVYKLGEVYFVLDGNHRVSVARQMGTPTIEAYVTEIDAKVRLSPEDQLDDIILKAEQAEFLEHTQVDKLRPEASFEMSCCGRFDQLSEHISVHRYFMGIEQDREIPYEEAVAHWVDHVYMPVVQLIREQGILRDFPGRTEADLYLWLMKHRTELAEVLGWEIQPEEAVAGFASRYSPKPGRVVARIRERIRDKLNLDEFDPGPSPGRWRREHLVPRKDDRLFSSILVAVGGSELGWAALEQALKVAKREEGVLRGLHIVADEAQMESKEALGIKAEFERRCEEAGVEGFLAFGVGDIAENIAWRAGWNDLVVVPLQYPPAEALLARLRSGLRELIQRSSSPVLAVPGPSEMKGVLLAYDDSPKAREALFLSTYLAVSWGAALVVVVTQKDLDASQETLKRARSYLEERGVNAELVNKMGAAENAILEAAAEYGCDLIVMGGYGQGPILQVVFGSTVDRVLRKANQPVMVCR